MSKFFITPDTKGRISLGKLPEGVEGYKRVDQPDGNILLIPMAVIPIQELWVHQTPSALESIERGLRQSIAGEAESLGSFSKFARDDK